MNLFNFLHFFNCKREHTTTYQILKYILDSFNNEKVWEKNNNYYRKNQVKHKKKYYWIISGFRDGLILYSISY